MRREEGGPFYVLVKCGTCQTVSEIEIPTQTELDNAMKLSPKVQCPECHGTGPIVGIFSQPAE